MKQPSYPVRFGGYFNTNLRENEHFIGHLLDTRGESDGVSGDWVQYEIPIPLMINNAVNSRMIRNIMSFDDNILLKGVNMYVEK